MAVRKLLSHISDTVSAGKLITLNVPSFHTINQLFLEFTNSGAPATLANISSSISNISLLLNGEEYINISPANLAKVYQSLGAQVGTTTLVNVLPLLVAQLLYKLPEAEATFDIGCNGVSVSNGAYMPLTNIQIQVQCAGTVTSVTDVKAYSERTDKGVDEKGNNLNVSKALTKLLSYFQGFTTTGTSEVDTLPRDGNLGYLFVDAIPDATGVIGSGECLVNNMPVIQNATIAVADMLVAERGFGPVSGVYQYSMTDGGISDMLSARNVTDLRFKTTFTTACTTGYTLVAGTVRPVA